MFLNLDLLKQNPNFRLLFLGQIISFLGSMISYVAVPYQVYQISKSSLIVGALGTVQLVPVLVFGLIGGAYADRLDRRKLLIVSEGLMSVGVLGFFLNSLQAEPSLLGVFVLTAILQSINAFHRPAMEALTQAIVSSDQYPAAAALSSLRHSVGAIVGPALGGVLISTLGIEIAYLIDFATFLVAMICIFFMKVSSKPKLSSNEESPLKSIGESLQYAYRKPELMGTYIVDIVAMTFAFPTALFPAMAESWGGAKAAGILYSSMSIGSLVVALFSRWTEKVDRHGAAVIIAAAIWGLAIMGLGFATSLWVAVVFLALAGAADAVSAIFRSVIWNETIPNERRGKLAGIEMISYMSGPLLGNMRSGWMAGLFGVPMAVGLGGAFCVIGVIGSGFALPKFWLYRSLKKKE